MISGILINMDNLQLLKENIKNENLIKHCFAVKAIMQGLAERFNKDKEKWGTAGLLHDIDYEKVKDDFKQHSLTGAKMLEDLGFEKDICQAIKAHNRMHGIIPETLIEKALLVADPLSGLIVASVLVLPSKKIADLEVSNVLKRFKEKAFAKGVIRENIEQCQEYLGLSLEDFVAMGLDSMKKVSNELGL